MAQLSEIQKSLFEEHRLEKLNDFQVLNKRDYRGIWNSVIDKYPESAHFIYELLQNADDAEATTVDIILQSDRLIFKHNGKRHFDIDKVNDDIVGDIASITGVGYTLKDESQNKIGKFGVGFKSVFQYTDTPEIYDDYFKFKIENYIVPSLLSHDYPNRKEGETLFVFPFKDKEKSYNEISNKIENLQNPILFIRNIQRIRYRIDTPNAIKGIEKEYSKKLLNRVVADNNITFEHYQLVEPTQQKEIFLFTKPVILNDSQGRELEQNISVGFFYDPECKKLITEICSPNIYCFFPTKETFNTCFLSHAPFLLTDNRQNLKPNEEINRELINNLAELATEAVLFLRDYSIDKNVLLINENIFEIIPSYKDKDWCSFDHLFERPIFSAFKKLIDSENILLSRNGKYLYLNEAYIGTPQELVGLLTQKQLYLLQKQQCSENSDGSGNVRNIDFLHKELSKKIKDLDDSYYSHNYYYKNIVRYNSEGFASDIDSDFMAQQEYSWIIKLYSFLINYAPKLWKEQGSQKANLPFRRVPIIKTQKGEWVAPYTNGKVLNVFFPPKEDSESAYNFIAQEYLKNEIAIKFFKELDIQEPNMLDYIREVILQKFEGEHFKVNDDDLMSDLIVLLNYYDKIKSDKNKCDEYIRLLQEKLYLVDSNGYLSPINRLYFYSNNLKEYFKNNDECVFVDLDFYSTAQEKFNSEFIHEFIHKLGVKQYPPIIPTINKNDIWKLNDRLRNIISNIDYQSWEITDYYLEGFENYCNSNSITKETSIYLWNTALPAVRFSDYGELEVQYRKYRQRKNNDTRYINSDISSFKYSLEQNKWLFNKEGELVAPKDIHYEDLDDSYDKNNGLIHFLNIEKRNKNIIELGGTEEDQETLNWGKQAQKYFKNKAEMEEGARFVKEKKRKEQQASIIKESLPCRKPSFRLSDKDFTETDDYQEIMRQKLTSRKDTLNNLGDVLSGFAEKVNLQKQELEKEYQLKEAADNYEQYSYGWLKSLMELEVLSKGTDSASSKRSTSILFEKIMLDNTNNKRLVLSNASRNIPNWLEDVDGLPITFCFYDGEKQVVPFDNASVKEDALIVRGNSVQEALIKKIIDHKSLIRYATIDIDKPIELIKYWKKLIEDLPFEANEESVKQALRKDLKFLFGPPGTGKTTTLAERIINLIKNNCRILVLTPTNKACDVLAKKILELEPQTCDWLWRFVATMDSDIEEQGLLKSRDSNILEEDQVCVVSTIARYSFDGFNDGLLHELDWDYVIIDEASMIPLYQILPPIFNPHIGEIWIAGDPFQIDPIVNVDKWKDENIYKMIELNNFANPKTTPVQFNVEPLMKQYRSIPIIGEVYSQYMYDGKLQHFRSDDRHRVLNMGITESPLNLISFPVNNDSLFSAKKLNGSNIHTYSILFTVEFLKYISKQIGSNNPNETVSIGVLSPYSAEIQSIQKLYNQTCSLSENITVNFGTSHGFQGDQCDIIIVVMNPPSSGLKRTAELTFINKPNILNVAVSRAKDYLFIIMPDKEFESFSNLYELKKLGKIIVSTKCSKIYTSDDIEKLIFGNRNYIESNTYVTTHQTTNIYTSPWARYEVRIGEDALDIQLND